MPVIITEVSREDVEDDKFWTSKHTRVPASLVEKMRREEGEKLLQKLAEQSEDGGVRSREVPEDLVQDYSKPIKIVGADVEQLYPSLEMKMAAMLVEKAILESGVEWKDFHPLFLYT